MSSGYDAWAGTVAKIAIARPTMRQQLLAVFIGFPLSEAGIEGSQPGRFLPFGKPARTGETFDEKRASRAPPAPPSASGTGEEEKRQIARKRIVAAQSKVS